MGNTLLLNLVLWVSSQVNVLKDVFITNYFFQVNIHIYFIREPIKMYFLYLIIFYISSVD